MNPQPNEPTTTTMIIAGLIQRLQNGDDGARDELIERSLERFRKLARKFLRIDFTPLGRELDTNDVVQAAVIRLMTTLRSVTPKDPRHFFALASQNISWELLTLSRQVRGRPGVAQRGDATVDPNAPENQPATRTNEADRWVNYASLHEAIAALEPQLREIVDLYKIQELPRAEVAQIVGLSERHVDRLWLRALQALGARLPA